VAHRRVPARSLEVRDDGVGGRHLGDEKEIVAHGAYVHVERMSEGNVWIGLQVGRRWLHIDFYAARKGVVVMRVEEEDHDEL